MRHVVFFLQTFLRCMQFLILNHNKLTNYLKTYKNNNRLAFNDLFRVIIEQTQLPSLYSFLKFLDPILKKSSNFLVLKIIVSYKLNYLIEVEMCFNKLINDQIKISPLYFDFLSFKDAYSRVQHHYSFTALQSIFKLETKKLKKKFFIGHISCLSRPDTFVDVNLIKELFECENSVFGAFEIIEISHLCTETTQISESYPFEFYDPKCFNDLSLPLLRQVLVPESRVWTLKDCKLIGASQVIKNNSLILYEKSSDPRNGFVAGIWNYIFHIRNSNKALINFDYNNSNYIKEGILISGRCSKNYFHWLIEYVPKILNILKTQQTKAPLIVDSTMPKQSFEILDYICKKHSLTYICIKPDDIIVFDKLIIPSQHTYQPDDPAFEYWEGSALSYEHLKFITELGLEYSKSKKLDSNYKNVYLTRKNYGARRLVNEKAIENLFKQNNFAIVDPTELSFAEQVHLFANAEIIASPTGAALANLIYCKHNTYILSLVADENKMFCIQANLAEYKKLNFMHVTGKLIYDRNLFNSYLNYRFSEFKVDLETVQLAINSILKLSVKNQI